MRNLYAYIQWNIIVYNHAQVCIRWSMEICMPNNIWRHNSIESTQKNQSDTTDNVSQTNRYSIWLDWLKSPIY